MPNSTAIKVFNTGSKTFFTASLFFPGQVRDDVFDLYAFVRIADDFVDSIPQQRDEYFAFKKLYIDAIATGTKTPNEVVNRFVALQKKLDLQQEWVDAFFKSMEMDLEKSQYQTLDETLEYIYGSAEVIGLMMAKVMQLPEQSFPYAAMLGRAFQYMNMIRDLSEDLTFNRTYFPQEDLQKFDLQNLSEQAAIQQSDQFNEFIQLQIQRYKQWRKEAEKGFDFIPKRYRIPIVAASESFDRTINIIEADPQIVFKEKVSASRVGIFWSIIKQIV